MTTYRSASRSQPATAPEPPEVRLSFRCKLEALRHPHTGLRTIRDNGGPVAKVTLGPRWLVPRIVVVSSPQAARDVLAARTDRSILLTEQMRRTMGENLVTMRPQEWKPRRRTIQPVFTKKHVATFAGHMADAADGLCAEWIRAGRADLDAASRRLALRVIGRSMFGYDLGERADELAPHVPRVPGYAARRAMRPVRAPLWLPTRSRAEHRRALAAVHSVIDEAIDRARHGMSGNAELIRQLMDATDPETGKGLSEAEIRDELTVFLLAGHDTTATTLAYALWALGRHPEFQERVAAEVARLGSAPVTAGDLGFLTYTRQVLQEALRLCPPGAGVARLATADVTVDGYHIEAGTNLIVAIIALHHDPEVWGEEVERFDPDRFSPERSAGRDRWAYLPFGAGPRGCIGEHFAMLEATIALATIVRTVEVESLEADFPLHTPFTTIADGPIPARIRKR